MITTLQLIIICITVLALAGVTATARLRGRRLEVHERMRAAEHAEAHKARLELTRRAEISRPLPVIPAPEVGATLAVHVDGRVVQGTLDAKDMSTYVVLKDASIASGRDVQPLGGRQYITASRVTQMQEL